MQFDFNVLSPVLTEIAKPIKAQRVTVMIPQTASSPMCSKIGALDEKTELLPAGSGFKSAFCAIEDCASCLEIRIKQTRLA